MPGLGTIINVVAIVVGGVLGTLLSDRFSNAMQEALMKASAVCVLFIGLAGALSGMISIQDGVLVSGRSLLIILSLILGTIIGTIIDIDGAITRFGDWLKLKTGNAKEATFTEAFVTASITVCVGAMAVVGAVEDALTGDISILETKAILDFIIVMAMTCSLGKGCAFSAIPVGIFQGSVTALAVLIKPLMTAAAIANLSMVGSILIFCVGINLMWPRSVNVANMLPAVIIAPALAFLPVVL
ncbi:DUF554 domain-containing protein [Slackia heliotrinireducens]|uniref:DUF554 domain-containing protein n=1 Tax=Slackia heliotrinireducens TaxID=84110 RepID=UPI0033153752